MPMTNLDQGQAIRSSYDESAVGLKIRILNTCVPANWDYVSLTASNSTTDVYTFKTGGSGGTSAGVITIVYTDSGHNTLSSVTRT